MAVDITDSASHVSRNMRRIVADRDTADTEYRPSKVRKGRGRTSAPVLPGFLQRAKPLM